MSFLQGLKGASFPKERLLVLLPVILMVLLVCGYLLFAQMVIIPGTRLMQARAAELAATKRQIKESQGSLGGRPDKLRQDLAAAQAAYSQTVSLFMSEPQAAQAVDHLYDHARESGVEIAELQSVAAPQALELVQPTAPPPSPAPPPTQTGGKAAPSATPKGGQPKATAASQPSPAAPQAKKRPYDVKSFHLQVRGPAAGLLGFMARIKEAALPTFIITNVSMTEAEGRSTLTFDFSLYTSPLAPNAPVAPAGAPSATPAHPTAAPPTTTPLPTTPPNSSSYLVRPTNWPTDWAWPPKPGTVAAPTATALPRPTPTPEQSPLAGETPSAEPSATPVPTPKPSPPARYITHVVVRGETLYSLSRRYGTTTEAIMAANGLASNAIGVGQRLRIPRP